MGTGILATLLCLHASGAAALGVAWTVVLVLAWGLLLLLGTLFATRCLRGSGVLVASLRDPAQSPMWGTVAMGVLAVGSATITVVPERLPALAGQAVAVDVVLWCLGTALGVYTASDFAVGLAVRDLGRPLPAWGLPVVAPMVSATTGCALSDHIGSPGGKLCMLVALVACFGISLVLGGVVFAVAYHHHWRREPLPLALVPSLWIPLGMVGQSTAAVQSIGTRSAQLLRPELGGTVSTLSAGYAVVVLAVVGTVLGGYAVVATARSFAHGMPFSPGWWAMTFPLGTCALGATFAGTVHHSSPWSAAGTTLTWCLVGTWSLCAVASLRALLVARAEHRDHTGRTA